MGGRGREAGVKGKGGEKKTPKGKNFGGVKLVKIQCGGLCPSSSTRAVCCREGTAGSDGLCVLWV